MHSPQILIPGGGPGWRPLPAEVGLRKAWGRQREEWRAKEKAGDLTLARASDLRRELRAYGTATVALEDGRLVLRYHRFETRLEHFHFDTYVTTIPDSPSEGETRVSFSLDADGEVSAVSFFGVEFVRQRASSGGGR